MQPQIESPIYARDDLRVRPKIVQAGQDLLAVQPNNRILGLSDYDQRRAPDLDETTQQRIKYGAAETERTSLDMNPERLREPFRNEASAL